MKSEKRKTILKSGSTATTSSPPYTPAGLKFAISVLKRIIKSFTVQLSRFPFSTSFVNIRAEFEMCLFMTML